MNGLIASNSQLFHFLNCQIEIVWVFSGAIPVLMVLAGSWRGTVNPLSLGPLVWTRNPSGVSGSIPLSERDWTKENASETRRESKIGREVHLSKPNQIFKSVQLHFRLSVLGLQYKGVGPLTNTGRVPHEKDNLELLRFVGRTNANIILTLSRPIRGELLYSNSLLSKAPQGRQKE